MIQIAMPDLVLLHAPSVYDFRKVSVLHGPISDVIPSTPIFEMYPIGFASLSEYLERFRFRVRIINLAYKMLRNRAYDQDLQLQDLRRVPVHLQEHVREGKGGFQITPAPHERDQGGGVSSQRTYLYHRRPFRGQRSTYRSALALNKVKMQHGLITKKTCEEVEKRTIFSLDAVHEIDHAMGMDHAGEEKKISELRINVEKISTIGEKKELEWLTGMLRMNFLNILKTIMG
jgi:hypothetical protein